MAEHYVIALLCLIFGAALAHIYIKKLRASLKKKWPKADPEAWRDKEDD